MQGRYRQDVSDPSVLVEPFHFLRKTGLVSEDDRMNERAVITEHEAGRQTQSQPHAPQKVAEALTDAAVSFVSCYQLIFTAFAVNCSIGFVAVLIAVCIAPCSARPPILSCEEAEAAHSEDDAAGEIIEYRIELAGIRRRGRKKTFAVYSEIVADREGPASKAKFQRVCTLVLIEKEDNTVAGTDLPVQGIHSAPVYLRALLIAEECDAVKENLPAAGREAKIRHPSGQGQAAGVGLREIALSGQAACGAQKKDQADQKDSGVDERALSQDTGERTF